MTDTPITPQPMRPPYYEDDEIDLLTLWQVIWRRRRMIFTLCIALTVLTAVISLFMENIYRVKAVVVPVVPKEMSGASLTALGSQISGPPGISLSMTATASEIVALLKANILREKMVERYNLMPILFYEKWDPEKKTWKKSGFSLNPITYVSKALSALLPPPPSLTKKAPDIPDMWDALRLLDGIIDVNFNMKDNTIAITVDFPDPEQAKYIADCLLTTLTEHMSSEVKRVAQTNRKYLEEQLSTTADPLIKQKTYNLIAQQIETAMMAEVKENFAFKVIDPPKAPDKKSKPKRAMMVIVAFITSLFLGIFIAFFLNYLETVKVQQRVASPEPTSA